MTRKAKVYFTNMRAMPGLNLQQKLEKLIIAAGIKDISFERKFTAIKIHFGEPGNLSFLRPNFAKTVADLISAQGGIPFLTDANTLYVGRRKNAIEHLYAAQENGFNPTTTGCQIIIADGLKGTDETLVPLSGTKYVKEAKIGRAVMDADIIISLNHFKGHEGSGFGGALKNVGMGCASRAGKMEQHHDGKPTVKASKCRACQMCSQYCAHGAISFGAERKALIDQALCVGCGRCLAVCPFDAIRNTSSSSLESFSMRMAEYSLAVLKDRPHFHINIVMQVSPYCDCHAENDTPIIPDVGMFASFDPVAIDMACADACNAQPVLEGSYLAERMKCPDARHNDHFTNTFPDTSWRVCLDHAEALGVGSKAYELVTV